MITRSQSIEGLADFDVAGVRRDHEAGVGEVSGLPLDALHHQGMGIAHGRDGDAGAQVDEGVAIDIDDHAPARTLGEDGHGPAHSSRNGGRATGHQLPRSRAGELGNQTALLGERGGGGQQGVGHGHERRTMEGWATVGT